MPDFGGSREKNPTVQNLRLPVSYIQRIFPRAWIWCNSWGQRIQEEQNSGSVTGHPLPVSKNVYPKLLPKSRELEEAVRKKYPIVKTQLWLRDRSSSTMSLCILKQARAAYVTLFWAGAPYTTLYAQNLRLLETIPGTAYDSPLSFHDSIIACAHAEYQSFIPMGRISQTTYGTSTWVSSSLLHIWNNILSQISFEPQLSSRFSFGRCLNLAEYCLSNLIRSSKLQWHVLLGREIVTLHWSSLTSMRETVDRKSRVGNQSMKDRGVRTKLYCFSARWNLMSGCVTLWYLFSETRIENIHLSTGCNVRIECLT